MPEDSPHQPKPGSILSGNFEGPVASGCGEAVDMRGSQGALYKPSGPVTQYFADQITIVTGETALPIPTAPPPPPHFVDREIELEKLMTRLTAAEPTAATALQGMGGSGKSALAKKLAHALVDHFPGGVLWTSLGMQPDQFHILESWALAVGGDVRSHTDPLNRAAAVRALLAARGRMLVILDDVWEVECPQLLIQHGLPAGATVVITTRDADLGKRLRCQIERIDTLSEADAVALLEKLLGHLGAYRAAAQQIARLTGYVPLALELAAGLADDPADLPDVARRLEEKPVLTELATGAGEQYRESIEACLSLSYAALPAEMQCYFRALGAFALSPFDTAAVAAVWGLDADAVTREKARQTLRYLARRSLLSRLDGETYSQHSLLRSYALALLERQGEIETLARRHAAYYLAVVQEGDWRVIEVAFRQIRHGWEAIKIHAPDQVAAYLLALVPFLRLSGRWTDLTEWAKYALEQESLETKTRGRLLSEMGYVYWLWGRGEEALKCLRPALSLCREANDRWGEGLALNLIGLVHRVEGRLDEAMTYFQDSLVIRREIGDREGEGFCLQNMGLVHRLAGRYPEALDFLQRGLAVFSEEAHLEGQSLCSANIGRVYRTMGHYDEALHYMQRGLDLAREIGDRSAEGETLDTIGDIYRFMGQYQRALEFYQQSLEVQREIDSPVGQAYAIGDSGDVYFAEGDYDRALEHYQRALELWRSAGDRKREASALNAIGCVHWVRGETGKALDWLQRSLTLHQEIGDRPGAGRALNHIGCVALVSGNFDHALRCLQQALAIARETMTRPGEGTVLNNIALLHARQGKYDLAFETLRRSLDLAQELGERAAAGIVWWNMSNLHRQMGQLGEAEAALAQASAIAGQLGVAYGDGLRRWFE
ncbi:MAG: tetratricopeptide repeat protein [Anaerolineae bacterium]|jgi:tetratricopeptide (TPR) repeat protein|nr:tetratricopeptide repeat protein [Anaerolineae bacterium]